MVAVRCINLSSSVIYCCFLAVSHVALIEEIAALTRLIAVFKPSMVEQLPIKTFNSSSSRFNLSFVTWTSVCLHPLFISLKNSYFWYIFLLFPIYVLVLAANAMWCICLLTVACSIGSKHVQDTYGCKRCICHMPSDTHMSP